MDFDEEGRESETPVAQAEDLSDWGNAGFRRKRACLSALLRDRTLFSRETKCLFVGCQYVTLKVDHAVVFIRRNSGTSE